MPELKLFEVRDRATFIPCFAFACEKFADNTSEQEAWLLRRAGFAEPIEDAPGLVVFGRLQDGKGSYEPCSWPNRTMNVAHAHITSHWDELKSGDVVDVEFILNETSEKKVSERALSA